MNWWDYWKSPLFPDKERNVLESVFNPSSGDEENHRLQAEVAKLREIESGHNQQIIRLQRENAILKQQLKTKEAILARTREKLEKVELQRDRYREMIFKKNVDPEAPTEETEDGDGSPLIDPPSTRGKRKRGGQKGHRGHGRKKPARIDEVKRIYLDCCPDCGRELPRSKETWSHIVEDLPAFEKPQTKTTEYQIERQWCGRCHKKVSAEPQGVISRCRLGINLLLYVMLQKYGSKISWETIVFNLRALYGVIVTEGALVAMVHRARDQLEDRYQSLLKEIRGSPVKHADETHWRVNGKSHWVWGFFTPTTAFYTIEESRGKGIPAAVLAGSRPEDVLVRDDYGAYTNLRLNQQSCWAHLMRKCREYAEDPRRVSLEMKQLYATLKTMYASLEWVLATPYVRLAREIAYRKFKHDLEVIANSTQFTNRYTLEIQGRIQHQNTRLITAVLHKNVPLTKNLAERQLRPMVVTRKISGGSRSWEGAKTHAINMSIFQTIRMQDQPLIPTLKSLILAPLHKTE